MRSRISSTLKKAAIAFGTQNKLIELTSTEMQSDQIITNKLVTSLLYESKRHGWKAEHCKALRQHIINFVPELANQSQLAFKNYIEEQETTNGTYYGSYLSDDSDSEEEHNFQIKPAATRTRIRSTAATFQARGQMTNITYAKKTKTAAAGDLKLGKSASALFDLSARAKIHYGPLVNQQKIKSDLDYLNILLKKNGSLEKTLKELRSDEMGDNTVTEFFIAEYRGITYSTTKWNKPSRNAHRSDAEEIGKRQYSASVYKQTGVNFFRDYAKSKQTLLQNPSVFDIPAEELREVLLTFREPRPYSYGKYTYTNLANLLQNIYTESYDGFHRLISQDNSLSEILLNDANPFLSMGDTPYHANKYAYGLKAYAGHEGDRIRPRWRIDGKAERPYSGVTYTSLHPIDDFTSDGPLHLITLNCTAEIKLKSELVIIAERESCFPAYLPENRVIQKHVAKYPSFKGEYKHIYGYKYGLSKSLYDKFKAKFVLYKPHTPQQRALKNLLGEWLCAYHETRMIDAARQEAENRGGVLIYRNNDGTFSLTPPLDSVNRNSSAVPTTLKQAVKQKQAKREALARGNSAIQPILNETSISSLIDSIGSNGDDESTDITHEGNHEMSLPLSLLLNAIKNQRYLALKRFLTIPLFQEAINEKFNTDHLQGATLLHLAAARNDTCAIQLLTDLPQCRVNATANELCENYSDEKVDFYEDITPAQLAILLGSNDAALMLVNHPRNDNTRLCAYVTNKDLLSGDMLTEESDDVDCLGVAWYRREAWPITRTRNVSTLDIAKEHNNHIIIEHLEAANLKPSLKNPS